MASGIFALLDEIAAIAKASASTLDDVASNAAKASTKSAAVVIDDAAVGPTYVVGIPADREIPIVKAIAWGSIKNKMLVIIPLALLLSQFAEWALPVLLTLGGLFLAFEGTEKVAEWLGVLKHHEAHHADDESSEAHERTLIGDAVRTDLILSTEIMLISLAAIKVDNFLERAAVLTMVGFMMTAVVYGAVAIVWRLGNPKSFQGLDADWLVGCLLSSIPSA